MTPFLRAIRLYFCEGKLLDGRVVRRQAPDSSAHVALSELLSADTDNRATSLVNIDIFPPNKNRDENKQLIPGSERGNFFLQVCCKMFALMAVIRMKSAMGFFQLTVFGQLFLDA